MQPAAITVKPSDLTLKIKVVGMRRAQMRLGLGAMLIRFGGWISGARCEVEIVET